MNTQPWTFRGARRRWSCLVLCAPLLIGAPISFPASAQQPTDAPFTLKQAVDAALARLPETQTAALRQQAANAQGRAARSWTAEPVALELSLKSDRLQSNRGEREAVVGVAAPLWLPGQRDGARALAQAERDAVDGRVAVARWRAVAAVRDTWWAVHAARQSTDVAQARLTHAQRLAADVARRETAGDLSRADRHQADGAVAAAEAELASARAAQAKALQALKALTGMTTATALDTGGEPVPVLAADAALASHPVLRELADKAEVARRTRALAGVQTRANPELLLATTRERGGAGEPSVQSLTIGLRIPFGSDDRQAAKLASASADQTEAEIQLALERERLLGDIQAAREQLAEARQAADASARRAALARETRGFYEKSFRLGETDLPNRLRIDLEDFEAERRSARDRFELAHAVSQLRQALGLLPE